MALCFLAGRCVPRGKQLRETRYRRRRHTLTAPAGGTSASAPYACHRLCSESVSICCTVGFPSSPGFAVNSHRTGTTVLGQRTAKVLRFGEGELLAVSLLHCTVQCMVQVCTPKRPPKRAHSNKVLEPGRVAHWQGGNTFHAPRTSRPCIARTRDDKGTTERTLTLDAA